jgi:Cu/Ag efflux protein CusF
METATPALRRRRQVWPKAGAKSPSTAISRIFDPATKKITVIRLALTALHFKKMEGGWLFRRFAIFNNFTGTFHSSRYRMCR